VFGDAVEILIVEDSITQALNLRFLLEKRGYVVSVCHSAEDALDYLNNHKPTLIISDIVMPGIDGYEFCKILKGNKKLAEIPIMLMTALSDPREIIKALASGATNFVTKPFDAQLLISRLQYILQNMAVRKESRDETGVRVFFAGESHILSAEPTQIVDLLFSSYETAVMHQRQLESANKSLIEANDKLEELTRELQELSIVDSLTELNNRRGFFYLAEQQLEIAKRHRKQMVLLYADLDDFKKINDTLGHQQGDRVLKEAAEILKQTFRSSDIVARVARLGGDEFVVLVLETTVEDPKSLIARLDSSVQEYNEREKRPYQLSFSVGSAVFSPENPCSIDELLSKADQMMYQIKRSKKAMGEDA